MSGMAGQPWLVVAGSGKSPVVEILTFQAVHFRTALEVVGDFTTSEIIFFPMSRLWLCGLCPLAVPPSSCWCPAISSDSHPPFQKGMQQMGCVASAQLWICRAACRQHSELPRAVLGLTLFSDPKTAKIPPKHPTFWIWSSKTHKPQPLCTSTTLRVLAGGNRRRICKMHARYYW